MDSQPGAPDPGQPDGNEEDGPLYAWLPPEDRLWRHPSEALRYPTGAPLPPERPMGGAGPVATRLSGHGGWGRTCAIAVLAGLVGALAASGVGVATGWWNHQTTILRSAQPTSPSVSLAEAGGPPMNWAAVEESVAASVVGVTVDGPAGPQQGSGLVMLVTGGASAFIMTDLSLFAPNQAASFRGTVTVTFLSGEQVRAKLVGEDSQSGLALLQAPDAARDIPAATGSVADIREADSVLAVGARSLGGGSLSTGSVSGEDRSVALTDGSEMGDLITVTMPPMTPQATGGPVLDQYGRVVGLTVSLNAADQINQQVTFAVPIDVVNRVATQLIDHKRVTHAWLGVSNSEDVPAVTAHQLSLDGGVEAGQVAPGSPAARAGLRNNDIITSLDGRPLTSTGALVSALATADPGTKVTMSYLHDGRTVKTTVQLADQPSGD